MSRTSDGLAEIQERFAPAVTVQTQYEGLQDRPTHRRFVPNHDVHRRRPPVVNRSAPMGDCANPPAPSGRRLASAGQGRLAGPCAGRCGAAENPVDLCASTPATATPSSTAVIAGTAPAARIADSQRRSASSLCGDGSPSEEKIVDSRATTARPSAKPTCHLG